MSTDHPPLSGMVLSGGRSRRLGEDKALLRLWGTQGPTLLEATIARLAAICDEVLVVSDGPHPDWPALSARTVMDRYPGGGSLGGIYTGLLEAAHPFALVVACDMPFLQPALLRYMASRPRDYDVLIPRIRASGAPLPAGPRPVDRPSDTVPSHNALGNADGALDSGQDALQMYVEPLHAIYGRPCLEPMRALLQRGERQIIRFFPAVRVRYLTAAELAPLDPQGVAFRNINTPWDLEEVRRILGGIDAL